MSQRERIDKLLLDRGLADSRTKAQAMADRDFGPSFRLKLAAKDAGLVTDAAWQHGLSLPVLEAIARRFSQAATGHGDHHISATYLASLPERAA